MIRAEGAGGRVEGLLTDLTAGGGMGRRRTRYGEPLVQAPIDFYVIEMGSLNLIGEEGIHSELLDEEMGVRGLENASPYGASQTVADAAGTGFS